MKIVPGHLEGLLVVEPDVFGDDRGYFLETWNRRRYADAGIVFDFVQDNISMSRRGILRGLHFQNPHPQSKLVSVLHGEVLDVALDIRLGSPTFGQWQSTVISGANKRQVFIPAGFAHGFLVRSETALFHYKCTDFYSAADELCIRWNDPDLGIAWSLDDAAAGQGNPAMAAPFEPRLSPKDAVAPCLRDLPRKCLFHYAAHSPLLVRGAGIEGGQVCR